MAHQEVVDAVVADGRLDEEAAAMGNSRRVLEKHYVRNRAPALAEAAIQRTQQWRQQ